MLCVQVMACSALPHCDLCWLGGMTPCPCRPGQATMREGTIVTGPTVKPWCATLIGDCQGAHLTPRFAFLAARAVPKSSLGSASHANWETTTVRQERPKHLIDTRLAKSKRFLTPGNAFSSVKGRAGSIWAGNVEEAAIENTSYLVSLGNGTE
jgi:hypothetical protein